MSVVVSEHSHPWHSLGIKIADPLGGNKLPITPWPSLKLHPIKLLHLCCHLGIYPHIPTFFQSNQASFEASDIAWFAAGWHRDRNYFSVQNSLHSEYLDLHAVYGVDKETCPHQKQALQNILNLIFDLVSPLFVSCYTFNHYMYARQHFWIAQAGVQLLFSMWKLQWYPGLPTSLNTSKLTLIFLQPLFLSILLSTLLFYIWHRTLLLTLEFQLLKTGLNVHIPA